MQSMQSVSMKESLGRSTWWLVLMGGIALALTGLMLLVAPGMTTLVLVQILGFYWMFTGALALVSLFTDRHNWGWKLFVGILGVLAGIIVLRHPYWSTVLVATTLVIILGIQALVRGAVEIYQAFTGDGWGTGILGVLNIIIGLFLLFRPISSALVLPIVVGILAIIGGVVMIISAFRFRSSMERAPAF